MLLSLSLMFVFVLLLPLRVSTLVVRDVRNFELERTVRCSLEPFWSATRFTRLGALATATDRAGVEASRGALDEVFSDIDLSLFCESSTVALCLEFV